MWLNKLMLKWLSFLIGLLFVFLIVFLAVYSPVIFQEGNPLPMFKGAIELLINDVGVARISNQKEKYLILNTNEGISGLLQFIKVKYGWEYYDQLGSWIVFLEGENRRQGKLRMWSSFFMIFELY